MQSCAVGITVLEGDVVAEVQVFLMKMTVGEGLSNVLVSIMGVFFVVVVVVF